MYSSFFFSIRFFYSQHFENKDTKLARKSLLHNIISMLMRDGLMMMMMLMLIFTMLMVTT